MSTTTTRTYAEAIEKLNTLQSNAATLEAMRAAGASHMAEYAIPEMIEYLSRIGYQPGDLNRLNVLHVTGTKGKGSTCAFADSLIRHASPSWKVGLYTSPHLVAVRERIRINGQPISEEQFAQYFFDVWDRLEEHQHREGLTITPKPMYFKFVTLVAYHTFLSLNVDATILEVGVGGMYDSTNIVPKPVVTGITALGLDHVAVLGKTLPEIAWQKGGIYKEGVPAFTVEQPVDALAVLQERAETRKASSFTVLPPIPELTNFKLGLHGKHQYSNATLAVHLAHQFLLARLPSPTEPPLAASPTPLSAPFIAGLAEARWPGRCQTVEDPSSQSTTWYLDGAHTVESLTACAEWYFDADVGLKNGQRTSPARVLIFNCTSGRSGQTFLDTLLSTGSKRISTAISYAEPESSNINTKEGFFDHVVFCTNVTYADGQFKGDLTSNALASSSEISSLALQHELASSWATLFPSFPKANIHVLPSIEHGVRIVRSLESEDQETANAEQVANKEVQVLVTGSLHLVGGVIEVAGLSEVALGN